MGVVYKAYDSLLDRFAAIKVMNTGGELDDELRARFFREARSAAKLNHPNIVAIYQMDEHQNQPFIAMEYVEGEDLKTLIKERVFIPFEKKIHLIIQVCRGLHYAHQSGVVHRDIKPGNIRVTRNGEVRILDFGLARLGSSDMTRTGMLMGTPYYMSPEQVKGARDPDGRSDLFSVGVVLYELISYERPFEADTPTTVLFRIVSEPHPNPAETLPGCADELAQIIDRALAKEREARFANGEAFARALEQFLLRLPDEQKSLALEVKSVRDEFEKYRSHLAPLIASGLFDASLFELEEPAGEQDDYGALLLRHRNLKRRMELVKKRREEVGPILDLFAQSRQQFEKGEWDACLKTLKEILSLHPGNSQAQEMQRECLKRLEERRREQERRLRLNVALDAARKALAEGNFEQCLHAVSNALKVEPGHTEALQLQRSALELQERRQKVERLLSEAHRNYDAQDYETCLKLSAEALELESQHPDLKELHRLALEALERTRKLKSLLKQAREHRRRQEYGATVEVAEKLLALDPHHSEALELKRSASEALERQRKVEELLTAARRHYKTDDYQACYDIATEGLELDLENRELKELQQRARQALERRRLEEERRVRIAELLEFAQGEMEKESFQSAVDNLVFLLEMEPGHTEALALKQRAEAALAEQIARVESEATIVKPTESDATLLKAGAIPAGKAPRVTKHEITPVESKVISIKEAVLPKEELFPIHQEIAPPQPAVWAAKAEVVVPHLPTPAVARIPWRLAIGAAAILAVLVIVFLLYRWGEERTGSTAATGTLVLNVSPWAKVDSITHLPDGKVVQKGDLITPCIISLVPGTYRVRVSNPHFSQPMEFDVTISAGQPQKVNKVLADFSLEKEIPALLEK